MQRTYTRNYTLKQKYMCTCMCASTITDTLQIYWTLRTELVADAISLPWMPCGTFFWPPTTESPFFPFMLSVKSLLCRMQSIIGERHALKSFPTCLSHLHSHVWTGSREQPSTGAFFCAFSSLMNYRHPKGILSRIKSSFSAKLKNVKQQGNKRQLQTLIMLIKHCVSDPNEDLSVNEECDMIVDRQTVLWSLIGDGGMCPHTLRQRCHQRFISPRRLLTLLPELRFMAAESVYCFPFSLSTWSDYH